MYVEKATKIEFLSLIVLLQLLQFLREHVKATSHSGLMHTWVMGLFCWQVSSGSSRARPSRTEMSSWSWGSYISISSINYKHIVISTDLKRNSIKWETLKHTKKATWTTLRQLLILRWSQRKNREKDYSRIDYIFTYTHNINQTGKPYSN